MSSYSLNELVDLLASPDPYLRDELAFGELATRIESGVADDQLCALGDRLVARLSDPAIEARTFAVLVVGCIVERSTTAGLLSRDELLGWWESVAAWYRSETDLRGWDEERGWLHAVAHGADALAAFASSPQWGADELAALLTLVTDRLLAPTGTVFQEREDERLGRAAFTALCRPEMSASRATTWLEPLERSFASAKAGPTPPWASNTLRTLRVVYVMVDRGARIDETPDVSYVPHRREVLDAVARVLRTASPYTS